MKTSDELAELLGEAEVANMSLTFWLDYYEHLSQDNKAPPEAYAALQAFQNGWLACREAYSINT